MCDTLAAADHLTYRLRRWHFIFHERIDKKTKIRIASHARYVALPTRGSQKKHLHNGTTAGDTVPTYLVPHGVDLALVRTSVRNLQEFFDTANTIV